MSSHKSMLRAMCPVCRTPHGARHDPSCVSTGLYMGDWTPEAAAEVLLPVDSKARKDTPIYSGVMAYFPLALAEIARLSKAGNDKHNPGQPLHWSREKSNDHPDCIARHLIEIGTIDPDDGHRHSTKLAWRALANLQEELEEAAKQNSA